LSDEIIECGIDEIDQYTRDVLSGEIPTCKHTRLAVERNQKDLAKQRDPDYPYYFNDKAAKHFFNFCEKHVKHYESSFRGEPFKLEPFQKFILGNIFGWLEKDKQHIRRFRTANIFMGKKQGKSFMAAVIALYMLCFDGEGAPQVYSVAKNRMQAIKLSFRAALKIRKWSPLIKRLTDSKEATHNTQIKCEETDGFFEPLTSNPEATDGFSVHCAILDEIKDLTDPSIQSILSDGTAARPNSLVLNITTAGPNTNSLGYEVYEDSKDVLQGKYDLENCFCIIYEADEDDLKNWDTEEVWRKANPNFGVSVSKSYFERKVKAAKGNLRKKNDFLTKHLNVWSKSSTGWLDITKWDDCYKDVSIEDVEHLPAIMTFDLSSKLDLTVVQLTFFEGSSIADLKLYPFTFSYLPEKRFTKDSGESNDRYLQKLKEWREKSHIIPCGEKEIAPLDVKDDILDLYHKYDVRQIGYDPSEAHAIINLLERDNILDPEKDMIEIPMGFKNFSEGTKTLEGMILSERVVNTGNPVLRWCLENTQIKIDHKDRIRPVKESNDEKIDASVCLIMAVITYIWTIDGQDTGVSSWIDRAKDEEKLLEKEKFIEEDDEKEQEKDDEQPEERRKRAVSSWVDRYS